MGARFRAARRSLDSAHEHLTVEIEVPGQQRNVVESFIRLLLMLSCTMASRFSVKCRRHACVSTHAREGRRSFTWRREQELQIVSAVTRQLAQLVQ